MKRLLEHIESLEQVRKRISDICDNYDVQGSVLPEDDIRHSFFNQLNRLIMSYNFGLVDFLKSINGENKVKDLFRVEDAFLTSEILLDYFRFLKNGLIYQLSTLIENYFRTVYRSLFPDKDDLKEFYNIRKEVFIHLNLKTNSENWKSLSVLYNIRNCIHNNGIYLSKRGDVQIEYHGQLNIFKNGEAHNSASPEIILLIVNDCVSIVKEINSKIEYAKDISHRAWHPR